MFSGEKSLSGTLLIYRLVEYCVTCGVYTPYLLLQEEVLFQGLRQETDLPQTPVHSFSCEETPDALCLPSSSSQKPVLGSEIIPPM